jgi:HlyD family secretion protein
MPMIRIRELMTTPGIILLLCVYCMSSDKLLAGPEGVSALGRLEPRDGLYAVAGPSGYAPVVASLMVKEGDQVRKGQVVALLDDAGIKQANVQRAEAKRANAANELARNQALKRKNLASQAEYESLQLAVLIAEAELAQARAELDRSQVKSPIDGRVIAIHTRDGERVGGQGILEVGRTTEMYAVAEVYETDIGRVRIGQKASASSPALAEPLTGTVARIGLKVGILEALPTDPVSRVDARVVEVEIELDNSELAEDLTNLHVEIVIEP